MSLYVDILSVFKYQGLCIFVNLMLKSCRWERLIKIMHDFWWLNAQSPNKRCGHNEPPRLTHFIFRITFISIKIHCLKFFLLLNYSQWLRIQMNQMIQLCHCSFCCFETIIDDHHTYRQQTSIHIGQWSIYSYIFQ